MSIVAELQREALDEKTPIAALLRRALVVAHKLDHAEMAKWIEDELNGYPDERTSIPTYRHLRGEAKVWNPYRGYQPLDFGSAELADRATKMPLDQAIAEIEDLVRHKNGSFACSYSPKQEALLMSAMQIPLKPSLHFANSQARGILDAVRNAILKWSLELEKKGVHGEGLTFSPQEKAKAAPGATTFNIQTYVGTMHNSQLQSDVRGSAVQTLTANTLDLDAVAKVVAQIEKQVMRDAPSAMLMELQADIASIKAQLDSPKPKHPVIREGLRSLRAVLEQAGGNLAASGVVGALTTLIGP